MFSRMPRSAGSAPTSYTVPIGDAPAVAADSANQTTVPLNAPAGAAAPATN